MIYKIIIPESVYEELNEAVCYYESKQKGLGVKLLLDWEGTMNDLEKSPLFYQKKHKQFRSIQLKHFPYLMVYGIEGNKIYTYRLIHAKRNPKKLFKK